MEGRSRSKIAAPDCNSQLMMLHFSMPCPKSHGPGKKHPKDSFLSGANFCTGDFAPPEPEFSAEFWDTNFGCPNFGPEFLGRIFEPVFSSKRGPQKNSPSRNSPPKIHLPKNSTQKSGPKIHIAPLKVHLAELSLKIWGLSARW